MKSFKKYLEEEYPKPEEERPPVRPTERHRRMSKSAPLKAILTNRILQTGEKIIVGLPPDIDPKAKEENR
jgi:hypothetical protein